MQHEQIIAVVEAHKEGKGIEYRYRNKEGNEPPQPWNDWWPAYTYGFNFATLPR